MVKVLFTSTILILLICLIRKLFMGKISRKVQYALWLVVAIRLLVPVQVFKAIPDVTGALMVMMQEMYVDHRIQELAEDISPNMNVQKNGVEDSGSNGITEIKTDEVNWEGNTPNHDAGEVKMPEDDTPSDDIKERSEEWNFKKDGVKLLRLLWIMGMVMGLAIVLTSNLIFYRRLRKSRKLLNEGGEVPIYLTDKVDAPCLYGFFHPGIYLNAESIVDETRKDMIVKHEVMHYRHRDHIWSIVRLVCVVIYWFDPFVWLAAVLSGRDCELACDESVMDWLSEDGRVLYGQMLLDMAVLMRTKELLYCSAGIGSGKKELKERIRLIMNRKHVLWVSMVILLLVLGTAVAAFGDHKADYVDGAFYIADLAYLKTQGYDNLDVVIYPAEGLNYTGFEHPVIITELSPDGREDYELTVVPAQDAGGMENYIVTSTESGDVGAEFIETNRTVIDHRYAFEDHTECCNLSHKLGRYSLKTRDEVCTFLSMVYDNQGNKMLISVIFDNAPMDLIYEAGTDYLILQSEENLQQDVEITYQNLQNGAVNTMWLLQDMDVDGMDGLTALKIQISDEGEGQIWLDMDEDGVFEYEYTTDDDYYTTLFVGLCDLDGGGNETFSKDQVRVYARDDEPIELELYAPGAEDYVVEHDVGIGVEFETMEPGILEQTVYRETLSLQKDYSRQVALSKKEGKQYILSTSLYVSDSGRGVYCYHVYSAKTDELVQEEQYTSYDMEDFKEHLDPWIREGVLLVSLEYLGTSKAQLTMNGNKIDIGKGYESIFQSTEKYVTRKKAEEQELPTYQSPKRDVIDEKMDHTMPDVKRDGTTVYDADILNDFYYPLNYRYMDIPGVLIGFVGKEAFEQYVRDYKGVSGNLNGFVNVYSLMNAFALDRSEMEACGVVEMGILTKDELDILYSGDEELIARSWASKYATVVGSHVYSMEWLYNHTPNDYKAVGITDQELVRLSELLEVITLHDEAKNRLFIKLGK